MNALALAGLSLSSSAGDYVTYLRAPTRQWRPPSKAPQKKTNDWSPSWVRSASHLLDASSAPRNRLTARSAFATRLEKALRDASDTVPLLADTLLEHIESIALLSTSAFANKTRDLDERGTRLWNLASKLKDDTRTAQTLALGPRA